MTQDVSHEKPCVLVVDDVLVNRELVCMLLEPTHRLLTADQGQTALRLAREASPDLILLDIVMPDMDGYQVCAQLQADPQTRDIPVIFLTMKNSSHDEAKGLAMGAVDYLTKPLDPVTLKARVKTHLEHHQMRRQLEAQNRQLQLATELKEDVERIIHHDLKTPLASIQTIPDVLLAADNLTQKQRDFLERLQASAWRMQNLLDSSLALLKMQYGDFEPEIQATDLMQILQDCLEELGYLIEKKRQLVRLDYQFKDGATPQSLPLLSDPLLCHIILNNLLKNACEAAPPSSEIHLLISETDEGYQIQLTNPGEVPTHIRTRFFDKYVTSGKPKGTGLGTFSARKMTEALGGQVYLDASQAGKTRIKLFLPSGELA